jgi:Rho family, other
MMPVGQEEFDRLRSLSYADTHVIMLCFSVESRDSFENVREKWWDEIARHCEGDPPLSPEPHPSFEKLNVGVKLALVALKCDLRDDEGTKEHLARYGEKCVSYDEGLAMAKNIKAIRYLGTITFGL